MTTLSHREDRVIPYSPEQMFDLVMDIGSYPDFVPWTIAARINRRDGELIWADLIVGYKMIREKFTSKVRGDRQALVIEVEYIDGPLKHLRNEWRFTETGPGHCRVDFAVDFEFRRGLLQRLATLFFDEVVHRMVGAFESRAHVLYGPPQSQVQSA